MFAHDVQSEPRVELHNSVGTFRNPPEAEAGTVLTSFEATPQVMPAEFPIPHDHCEATCSVYWRQFGGNTSRIIHLVWQ